MFASQAMCTRSFLVHAPFRALWRSRLDDGASAHPLGEGDENVRMEVGRRGKGGEGEKKMGALERGKRRRRRLPSMGVVAEEEFHIRLFLPDMG